MSHESDENSLSLPTDNLRRYINNAVLPDFPTAFPMAGGSQNGWRHDLLSTEPDLYRKLKKITYSDLWSPRVAKFCEVEIPSSAIDVPKYSGSVKQRSRISIPSPTFRVEKCCWPENLDEVESVNEATRAVLCTAERIVSLLWSKRADGFKVTDTPCHGPASLSRPDLAIAAYSFYGRYGYNGTKILYDRTGVVVISMPCWVIGDNEMKEFTQCRTLPSFQSAIPGQELPSFDKYQKIWAKLWDLCAARNCHLFILTNYHSWVFGAFQTPGLGRAKCSKVIDRRNQSENGSVLKWIVFWFAAALNIQGTCMFSRSLSSNFPDIGDKERLAPLDLFKVHPDPNNRLKEDMEWLNKIKRVDTIKKDITVKLEGYHETWFTQFEP